MIEFSGFIERSMALFQAQAELYANQVVTLAGTFTYIVLL
jgi:hypothetical protein